MRILLKRLKQVLELSCMGINGFNGCSRIIDLLRISRRPRSATTGTQSFLIFADCSFKRQI